MTTRNNNIRMRLGVEVLEDRTVPTYFGTNGATGPESIAIGAVLASTPGTGPNQVIQGAGPGQNGGQPGLVTIRSTSLSLQQQFYPFGQGFTNGVYVATGDVTGDGRDDLICSTGAGTTGTVNVYEFANGGMQLISSFTPFGANYTGGIDVTVGNVTGDIVSVGSGNANQIIVGMAGGGSMVQVYGYDNTTGTPQYDLLSAFQACATGYVGGVTLAATNISTNVKNNYASIITGRATGLPIVSIWNAQGPTVTLQARYTAFLGASGGVNVAANDTDGARGAQIYVNLRGTGLIRVFDGETSAIITTLQTYPPNYATMVNMAIGNVGSFAPTQDDPLTPTYYGRGLVVVAANNPNNVVQLVDQGSPIQQPQTPVVFPGAIGRPAGLNGSHAL
jgi:hypothetical protein